MCSTMIYKSFKKKGVCACMRVEGGWRFFTCPGLEISAGQAVAEAVGRHHRDVVHATALQVHGAGRARGVAQQGGVARLRLDIAIVLQAALAGLPGDVGRGGLALVVD